jgi:hypothetical protein
MKWRINFINKKDVEKPVIICEPDLQTAKSRDISGQTMKAVTKQAIG